MPARPLILVKNRKTGERGRYRLDQERALIGREKTAFILLQDKTVSRRHAEILHEGERLFVKDLKSDNQTYLNEIPLPPEERTVLKPSDIIRVGSYDLIFEGFEDEGSLYEKTDSDILEVKMVKKLLKSLDHSQAPTLEIIEGTLAGHRFLLEGKRQEVTIGRDAACEFRIDSDVISRKHARLIRHEDMVEIEDLGSRNGVYVSGERVRKRRLKDGARVHLGTVVLIFRNPQELEEAIFPEEKEAPPSPPPPSPPPPKKEKFSSRATQKSEPEMPLEETLEPSQRESLPPPKKGLSMLIPRLAPIEILLTLIGLAVLIGAVWGIWKIL